MKFDKNKTIPRSEEKDINIFTEGSFIEQVRKFMYLVLVVDKNMYAMEISEKALASFTYLAKSNGKKRTLLWNWTKSKLWWLLERKI